MAVEIYIDDPIEHGSDRELLKRAAALLSAAGIPAILIANTQLAERQIDLIVAIDDHRVTSDSDLPDHLARLHPVCRLSMPLELSPKVPAENSPLRYASIASKTTRRLDVGKEDELIGGFPKTRAPR